jgi:hypothetical protein
LFMKCVQFPKVWCSVSDEAKGRLQNTRLAS